MEASLAPLGGPAPYRDDALEIGDTIAAFEAKRSADYSDVQPQ